MANIKVKTLKKVDTDTLSLRLPYGLGYKILDTFLNIKAQKKKEA